jgi:hypothetical protein
VESAASGHGSAARHAAHHPGCTAHHCHTAVTRGASLVWECVPHAGRLATRRFTHTCPAPYRSASSLCGHTRSAPGCKIPRSLPGMQEEGRVCRTQVASTAARHTQHPLLYGCATYQLAAPHSAVFW